MEELKRFENDLQNNEKLRKKLAESVRQIAEEGRVENDGEVMVAAAKRLGYNITITALEKAKAEAQELDAEELRQVAGGESSDEFCFKDYGCEWLYEDADDNEGHGLWCLTGWHCHVATVHTDGGSKRESCWSDYICLVVKHTGWEEYYQQ